MSCLYYKHKELFIEKVSLTTIAEKVGTPTYIYSRKKITDNWQAFKDALPPLPHRIAYAVKANSNLAILQILAKLGASFDIVSAGELARVIKAGGNPHHIIFSGVGKQQQEIEQALHADIYCFNVESEAELMRLNQIANTLKKVARIALRVNPDVDPITHAYISTGKKDNKFGISADRILPLCSQLHEFEHLQLIGIAAHIGSQITELTPFSQAMDCLLAIYQALQKMDIHLKTLNLGGGLGIQYHEETPPSISAYIHMLSNKLASYPTLELILEPGRVIVGNAGVLLTRLLYLKITDHKNFAIVDAGMNDLLRPALYQAWQPILPVKERHQVKKRYDIAGPVCESADFLGKDRALSILPDDLLAIDCAGAYGFSMASHYNSRPHPAEILVDGDTCHLIRRRENVTDLFAAEDLLS